MITFLVYSGSIKIGQVRAKTIIAAMNKAQRIFKHSGIWVRSV